MSSLLDRLVRATHWGGALALVAGCSGAASSSSEPYSVASDATADGSEDPDASGLADAADADDAATDAPSDAHEDAGPLPEVPYPDPTCYGPVYDGGYFHGQCCEKVNCVEPVNGDCPLGSEVVKTQMTSLPAGACHCNEEAKGPFAPRGPGESACCYLIGVIPCDGRPLIVNEVMRLAALVARNDWGARRLGSHG